MSQLTGKPNPSTKKETIPQDAAASTLGNRRALKGIRLRRRHPLAPEHARPPTRSTHRRAPAHRRTPPRPAAGTPTPPSKQQKWLTTKLRRLWLTTAPACPCRMCKWRASATSLTPKGADHLSPLAVASSVKRRGVSALRDRETTNVLRRCL